MTGAYKFSHCFLLFLCCISILLGLAEVCLYAFAKLQLPVMSQTHHMLWAGLLATCLSGNVIYAFLDGRIVSRYLSVCLCIINVIIQIACFVVSEILEWRVLLPSAELLPLLSKQPSLKTHYLLFYIVGTCLMVGEIFINVVAAEFIGIIFIRHFIVSILDEQTPAKPTSTKSIIAHRRSGATGNNPTKQVTSWMFVRSRTSTPKSNLAPAICCNESALQKSQSKNTKPTAEICPYYGAPSPSPSIPQLNLEQSASEQDTPPIETATSTVDLIIRNGQNQKNQFGSQNHIVQSSPILRQKAQQKVITPQDLQKSVVLRTIASLRPELFQFPIPGSSPPEQTAVVTAAQEAQKLNCSTKHVLINENPSAFLASPETHTIARYGSLSPVLRRSSILAPPAQPLPPALNRNSNSFGNFMLHRRSTMSDLFKQNHSRNRTSQLLALEHHLDYYNSVDINNETCNQNVPPSVAPKKPTAQQVEITINRM